MDVLRRDLRLALRQLRRSPAFALLAVASLAVGIGATTTIFSVANALLLRPLPLRDAGRLVHAYESSADGSGFHSFSYPQYRDLRDRARSLAGLAAFDVAPLSVATGNAGAEPRITLGLLVSGNYFRVLGTTPALGRFFLAEEDSVPGARAVAVVSDAFWRRRLGGDPAAVGRTIRVNGRPFTVVGVARPDFAGASALLAPDVWTPTMMAPVVRPDVRLDARGYSTFQLVGRLADGVARERAERELEGIAGQVAREHPEAGAGRGVDLFPFTALPTEARGGVAVFTALLMTFAALILLVACGNLASMLLARGVHRRREIAIRTALGSGRGRLVRQLVTETVVLFVAGAGAAVLLAAAAARALAAFRPPVDVPVSLDVPIDGRVLAFAAAVALVVGTLFGLLPALRATRAAVAPTLRETGGGIASRSRARSALVVGQVAFTFLLLVGAGLSTRALRAALDASPGFDRRGLYLATTSLQMGRQDAEGAARLVASWEERVAARPGVAAAALTTRAPLGLGNSTTSFRLDDGAPGAPAGAADDRWEQADHAAVSPAYFATLRVPLVAGRAFAAADGRGAPRVVVVSAALARRHFGDPSRALGRVLRFGRDAADRATIVGVAADTRVRSLVEEPRALVYEALAQTRVREVALLARAAPGAPLPELGRAVRAELRALDADLPLISGVPYDEHVAVALLPQRLAATVAATLGAAGVLLAAVGVYGIVAYAVSQRTREIGVRVAVGASARSVVTFMAAEGLRLAALGLGVGIVLALAATRLMRAFLLGVSPTDPLTFAAIAAGLAAVAVAACALPARRAARVDPMVALRSE